jgi:uncharacterized protein YndB with AHSA1/START domain
MTYRSRIDIDAPVERVWDVLMDVEKWPDWSPTMTTVKRLESGMFRPGSSARVKQPRLPEAIWRVSAMVPQKSFTWSTRSRGVTTVARHLVTEREEGGTRAGSEIDQTGPLSLLARVFFSRLTKRYLDQEAQGLKQRCETGREAQ